MFDTKWEVIGRGLRGWHATSSESSSCGSALGDYVENAKEGAIIYDAIDVDEKVFIKFVMNGPVCSPGLPPGTNERFRTELLDSAKRMLPGMEGIWKDQLSMAINNPDYCGLDRVSPDVYEEFLRKVPGMKVGHIREGKIVWD
jgi:hypothetical protein